MLEALRGIRTQEARHAIKMARIRACNMALFFAIMPVVSFITFAVVRPMQVPSGQWHACCAPCNHIPVMSKNLCSYL